MSKLTRIFSGIQPTGIPHIGNYLGAISNWVELQQKPYKLIYSIVDLHAITIFQKPELLKKSIRETTIALLACGIDPKKSILFVQSHVPSHAELCWLLSCNVTIGRLSQMTQFKDKSKKIQNNSEVTNNASIGLGLLSYPVLMSADILLYHASLVPVGNDQFQHLELARDIASHFNQKYGDYFTLPKPLSGAVHRVMSLRNGLSKMSKSDASAASRIDLDDDIDTIARKIKRSKTDSIAGVYCADSRPEISNLIRIFSALSNSSIEQIESEYKSKLISVFKDDLIQLVSSKIGPISARIAELRNDTLYIDSVLKNGSEQASEIAQQTMKEVRQKIGLD